VAPDSDSDEGEPNEIPPPHDRLPTYINPNADADFLRGEWGFIHTANDLWGCDLNAFEGEEWRRHIAVLAGHADQGLAPWQDDNTKRRDALMYGPVIRLAVYDQILGFRNAPQLRRHLVRSNAQDDVPVHKILGFDSIPHQNTIRDSLNDRMGPRMTEYVKNTARKLEIAGIKRGYEFPDIDERRLSNNGGITEIPVERKRGYAHGVLDLLRDDMPISKNEELATWTDYGQHFDFSLHLCDSNGTPEGELENFADNRGLQKGADVFKDAETFRNDIYRVGIEEWEATFDKWTERLLDAVYPETLRSRDLPISIDTTNIPTWSSEPGEMDGVVGTEKLKNTHYAYQILSGVAVSDGMPFQLAHELQMDGERWDERLDDLLDAIEDRGCNIGLILADADFASGRIANHLKGRGIDFVISYPRHHVAKYTDEWENAGQTFGVTDYTINKSKTPPQRADVTLFGEYQSKLGTSSDDAQKRLADFIDPEAEWATGRQDQSTLAKFVEEEDAEDVFEANNRMRWFTFITNLDVSEAEARALREYYHYRWAVESAYSVYKQHFLPTTKSTNLGMRTYLYLFGMTTYNAWVAANTKARRQHLEDSERKRPPIRASRFMTLGQQRYRTDEFHRDYISFSED
jgi:hypothetical protein